MLIINIQRDGSFGQSWYMNIEGDKEGLKLIRDQIDMVLSGEHKMLVIMSNQIAEPKYILIKEIDYVSKSSDK